MAATQVFHFSRRLNQSDAKYYFLGRRRDCNVAMVMVAMLAREISLEQLVEEFAPYEDEVPRFVDYMRPAPLNIGPPIWMPLPLDERRPEEYSRELRLPPGAGWSEVFAAVDEFQAEPFETGRAPWDALLVNGAPGGRSVLVGKVHHALSDGMAFAILFAKAFAKEVLEQANAPIEIECDPPPPGSRLRVALNERGDAVRHWLDCAREALPELGDPDRRQRERESVRKLLRPPLRWPLRSYRTARRLSGFRVVAATWQAEAEARGGGSNELFLALVARIVRRSFERLDFDAEPLRVGMPISLRGGRGLHDGRNTVAMSIVELPGRAAELADLSAVRERASAAKQRVDESSPTLFEETLELLPGPLRAAIEFRQGAACDVLATNIPIPLQGKLGDVPVEMMFMVAPSIGQAVSFSLTAYGEHLYLAGNADRGIVPNPIDDSVEATLAEVFGDRFEGFGDVA